MPVSGLCNQQLTQEGKGVSPCIRAEFRIMIFDRQHSELATALVVATTLNDVPVPNGSFEAPSVGANLAPHPVGTTWTFEGDAGIAGNGSGFANAPDGTQVGYVQSNTGAATISRCSSAIRARSANEATCWNFSRSDLLAGNPLE